MAQGAGMVSTRWLVVLAASLREVVLGVNDGLVSVTGLVVGVGASGVADRLVLLAGLAAASAATVSMAVGTYLAAAAEHEYQAAHEPPALATGGSPSRPPRAVPPGAGPGTRAAVMAAAVLLGSLPPLVPFALGIPSSKASGTALLLAAAAAFGLGVAKGRITATPRWRSGFVFVAAAGLAAGGGMLVGRLLGGSLGVVGP